MQPLNVEHDEVEREVQFLTHTRPGWAAEDRRHNDRISGQFISGEQARLLLCILMTTALFILASWYVAVTWGPCADNSSGCSLTSNGFVR